MLAVSTKKDEVLSDFTVHRNYRTLNYMHLLSVHSHNIPSLFPCIGNILRLINYKANDDLINGSWASNPGKRLSEKIRTSGNWRDRKFSNHA